MFQKIGFDGIGIDDWLRVPSVQDVFAIGDCSRYMESTGKPVLPALAWVSYGQLQPEVLYVSFLQATCAGSLMCVP